MASPSWQGFTAFVTNQIAAVQGALQQAINATSGSVMLALAQSSTSVALWLQAWAIQILTITRAATSNGADLDSWMADYGLIRLAAAAAGGVATFARYTASQAFQALVPVGSQISTGPGGIVFQVTADPTNPAWSASQNGYVIGIGVASVTVPISAVVAGTTGNVLANTIQSFVSPIPYVDTVTNPVQTGVAPYRVGTNAETDPAFRLRFIGYLNGLSKGTVSAITSAINAVQQGLTFTLTENKDVNGNVRLGYFFVVIDDGSGAPPTPLLTEIATAIDAVRPVTSVFGVFSPQTVFANVVMQISVAPGYDQPTVAADVAGALTDFINTLPVGAALPYSQLFSVAYTVAGVVNAFNVTLNGGTADLTVTALQTVKAGTIGVS